MYWSLKKPEENNQREATTPVTPVESENETDVVDEVSNLSVDDTAPENASTP